MATAKSDSTGRQCYRRLGRAWVEPDGRQRLRKRRGRPATGYLDRRMAERAMDALIDDTERALTEVKPTAKRRSPTR